MNGRGGDIERNRWISIGIFFRFVERNNCRVGVIAITGDNDRSAANRVFRSPKKNNNAKAPGSFDRFDPYNELPSPLFRYDATEKSQANVNVSLVYGIAK